MGRVRKKRIKIKYGKSKGTIPRPIVFSETKAGMKAAARQRRRRAAAPKETIEAKKPIEPKETIEPVTAVDFKEPVPAVYEPEKIEKEENIETEIQSITSETIEQLTKVMIYDHAGYGVLQLSVKELAGVMEVGEKEAAEHMGYMIKGELKKLIDEGYQEKTVLFLDMLREKNSNEFSTIFDLKKREATHLKSAMMGERFLTLIDPNLTITNIEESGGMARNTILNYRTVLRVLGPEIAKYRGKATPIDKMSDLYNHILDLIEENKDGITATEIIDSCAHVYRMPKGGSKKSGKTWKILDEIARVEKDGKTTFRDGKYFPCWE